MAANRGEAFWQFSLTFYAKPGVSSLCLALQDENALDVNLLLLCLWSGAAGPGELGTEALRRCVDGVHDWQQRTVKPLRALRRQLKTGGLPADMIPESERLAFREKVSAVELQSERLEQLALVELLGDLPARPVPLNPRAAAARNLRTYLGIAGVPLAGLVESRLDALLAELISEA